MTTTRKVDRRERDIKKKLSAAVIMLLLSCIMVVTSTYAWFTLSTAPEVTGISTTIGGNGNLEIALAGRYDDADQLLSPADSTVSDGSDANTILEKNITWGNLIDVSDEKYGLNQISLYPSALNLDADSNKVDMTRLLKVPTYGPDGRIKELLAKTDAGVYDITSKHFTTSKYGVRGIGVSSSKTERQFAYSGALSNINTNMLNAEATIESALGGKNGEALTQIAINVGLGKDEFTYAHVQALKSLIDETYGTEQTPGALPYLKKSINSFIDGILASNFGKTTLGINDTVYKGISQVIANLDIDDTDVVSVSGDKKSVNVTINGETYPLPYPDLAEAIADYQYVSSQLALASEEVNQLLSGANAETTYTETQIRSVIKYIMNFSTEEIKDSDGNSYDPKQYDSKVTVEGLTLGEIIADKEGNAGTLAGAIYAGTGLDIELNDGSGIYYNLASLIGEIKSTFTAQINVKYAGIDLNENALIIITSTPENIASFDKLTDVISKLGDPGKDENSAETNQIDDLYAFALDLYFRTNAANSNLILQTDPAQRIYEDGNNVNTLGNGSSMTFKYDESLSKEKVQSLLNSINIVFINSDPGDTNGDVLAFAKLDTANATFDGYSVTAKLYIYEENELLNGEEDKQVITSLEQNKAHLVTTLVYLDGNTVTNADVSIAAQSMTGSLNLQFASDVELNPMDYTELKQGDTKVEEPAMSVSGNNLSLTGLDSTKTYTLTYKSTTTVTTDTALNVPTITDGTATVNVSAVLNTIPKTEDVTFTLKVGSDTVTALTTKGTQE